MNYLLVVPSGVKIKTMNALSLTALLNSPVVPFTGTPRMVYMLVEIGGGKESTSMPVNLGLVIDASESMQVRLVTKNQFKQLLSSGGTNKILKDGIPAWEVDSIPGSVLNTFPRKIDYVSDALQAVSEYLRPGDYFSLAAFASRAELLLPMTSGRDRYRLSQKARKLENLRLGDDTRMAEGIRLAYTEIREKQQDNLAGRMILLTDGYTQDAKECYEWAQRAKDKGLVITTMGLGVEFNEDLLIPIAEMTGGNAYYVEKPGQVIDAFRQELGAAFGITYHGLKLHIHPSSGVELRQIYRVHPEIGKIKFESSQQGRNSCFLGNYDPDLPPAVLLELIVPPWSEGVFKMASLRLSWQGELGRIEESSSASDIEIRITPFHEGTSNERVTEIVNKVGAFKFGNFALEEVKKTNQTTAIKRLRLAAKRYQDVGETALSDEMTKMADRLDKREKLDSNATKKIRYETRLISRKS